MRGRTFQTLELFLHLGTGPFYAKHTRGRVIIAFEEQDPGVSLPR